MANEDGCGSSSSLALSPAHPSGNTRHDRPPVSPGSYELQPLPDKAKKARNIATSETPSDDDLDSPAGRPETPTRSVKTAMSRVPLLVRSSPAQGTGTQTILRCQAPWSSFAPRPWTGAQEQRCTRRTEPHSLHVLTPTSGSYGGLPILSSSPEESDENNVIKNSRKKKGKSRLSHSEPSLLSDHHQNDSTRSEPILSGATKSRRRTGDASRSSTTLGVASSGQDFEARFNASGLDPSTAGAPLFDNSTSSSSTLDDNDSSEDDDLHDMKGSPSDNSPYAQVRASVAATDDLSLSIDTPRMWFLSILFSIAGSSTNLFFSLRYPSVSLTPIIALLLVHPLGLLWDQLFKRHDDPEETFVDGCSQTASHPPQAKATWKRRIRLWLGQGRWNEKEHCCVYVSSNVSFGFAFATDVSIIHASMYGMLTTQGHR